MKLTAFPSTTPIYMFFFSMLGMLSVVTAVAIPNAGPAAVDGTGVTPGMTAEFMQTLYPEETATDPYCIVSYSNSREEPHFGSASRLWGAM